MSGREVASASTAMISLLTVMSKPVSRVMPCAHAPAVARQGSDRHATSSLRWGGRLYQVRLVPCVHRRVVSEEPVTQRARATRREDGSFMPLHALRASACGARRPLSHKRARRAGEDGSVDVVECAISPMEACCLGFGRVQRARREGGRMRGHLPFHSGPAQR